MLRIYFGQKVQLTSQARKETCGQTMGVERLIEVKVRLIQMNQPDLTNFLTGNWRIQTGAKKAEAAVEAHRLQEQSASKRTLNSEENIHGDAEVKLYPQGSVRSKPAIEVGSRSNEGVEYAAGLSPKVESGLADCWMAHLCQHQLPLKKNHTTHTS